MIPTDEIEEKFSALFADIIAQQALDLPNPKPPPHMLNLLLPLCLLAGQVEIGTKAL